MQAAARRGQELGAARASPDCSSIAGRMPAGSSSLRPAMDLRGSRFPQVCSKGGSLPGLAHGRDTFARPNGIPRNSAYCSWTSRRRRRKPLSSNSCRRACGPLVPACWCSRIPTTPALPIRGCPKHHQIFRTSSLLGSVSTFESHPELALPVGRVPQCHPLALRRAGPLRTLDLYSYYRLSPT
jgi:hypothetical protein